MTRHRIPQVIDDKLILLDADGSLPSILVGSADWYAWLNDAATRSFAYHSAGATLTARRERQHGHWYWYAYRSQHGDLYKAYLGKAEELTSTRLHDVASLLTVRTVASTSASDIAKPATPSGAVPPSTVASAHPTELLMTKLYVPPTRLSMVPRPRLTNQLNVGVRSRLTLIVAPAGWGKTTLLSAWHADPSRIAKPVAWVSLDADDNDPIRFWTYVITALNMLHPEVGKVALALLSSPQPPIESVLTLLLNALAILPTEMVLVLDDYHLIEAQPIHNALTFLLDHLPPRLHLVIASRLDPPLSLARLRARDCLTELRATELRFTPEEAAAFLTEVMGLPLSREEIAALEARTEGWIAGLHLAAAIRWAERSGLSIEDELSYPREPEYLTLARVHIAQGREHPTGPFLSKALVLLARLLEDAEPKARMSSVIEILILRALALEVQGERAEALTALDRALTLAEPEGYMRLFIDEGAPIATLLRKAHMHDILPGYVAHLLAAFAQAGASLHLPDPNASPLVEPLTGREREVLQLLVDGASNREIAQRLVLSVNTVKKHVFNICGKLGVQSRTQAIAKARTLDLLRGAGEKL